MDISYYKKYEPIDGKWYITKELGSGSFGKVFEVERKDFGNMKSAMKIISVPSSESEIRSFRSENYDMDDKSVTSYFYGFVEEFIKEFQIMSQLKGHSNIVNYEDHDVKEKRDGIGWDIFIRMELLKPMNDYFKEHMPTQSDVIKLGIDMCKALEVCQKHNIIHRDIKPSNIFVSDNGDFKLGDFGVARTLEKTSSGLSKKGTYTYMAPEVFKGEAYGASVDTYSLGIVMYKLLNNNLEPFRKDRTYSDSEAALIRRMKGEKIPAPQNADQKLAKVILKACSYNPAQRYHSPTQMLTELENCLAKDEVEKPICRNKAEQATGDTAHLDEPKHSGTISIFESKENETVSDIQVANKKTTDRTVHFSKIIFGLSVLELFIMLFCFKYYNANQGYYRHLLFGRHYSFLKDMLSWIEYGSYSLTGVWLIYVFFGISVTILSGITAWCKMKKRSINNGFMLLSAILNCIFILILAFQFSGGNWSTLKALYLATHLKGCGIVGICSYIVMLVSVIASVVMQCGMIADWNAIRNNKRDVVLSAVLYVLFFVTPIYYNISDGVFMRLIPYLNNSTYGFVGWVIKPLALLFMLDTALVLSITGDRKMHLTKNIFFAVCMLFVNFLWLRDAEYVLNYGKDFVINIICIIAVVSLSVLAIVTNRVKRQFKR